MRIRVVSSSDEINSLGKNERTVHFAFRPSNKDIITLTQSSNALKYNAKTEG